MNQNQGPMVAMILVEPKKKDVDVSIVTCRGEMTGDDEPFLQIQLEGKKKSSFKITTEKETFFEAREAIGRNLGKSPVYEMPYAFDSSLEVGPLQQPGTLQLFFEGFLSLA